MQNRLSVLLDSKLLKKLEERSEQYGLTKSQYVRFCLDTALNSNIRDNGKFNEPHFDIRDEFMNNAELSLAKQIALGIHSKLQKQLRGFTGEVQKMLNRYIENWEE